MNNEGVPRLRALPNEPGHSARVGFQFPVDGDFEACGRFNFETGQTCPDQTRYVEYLQTNSGFHIVCGDAHHIDYKGKTFISPGEFEPGEDLADVPLPPELRPSATRIRAARWKVSSATRRRLDEQGTCALCKVPQLTGYVTSDAGTLIEWISNYDADLRERIRIELANKPGTEMREWYAAISTPLRTEIVKRLSLSVIHADHGNSRKVGDAIWARLSTAARRLLQEGFIFPLCRKCNNKKRAELLPLERLTELYAEYNYDSIALARADLTRWAAFQEITSVAYEKAAG